MGARGLSALVIIATLAILGGCSSHHYHQGETPLEKNWGRSFESAKYNQMLNPDAGDNPAPVVGLDGEAAETVWKGHLKKESGTKGPTEFGVVTGKQNTM
jgi:hypothetical protein